MNNHLITQGNNLIEARYQYPLTAREQKIILTMVSRIQPEDEDFSDYFISVHEFHEMLGLEGREKYTELKAILKTLTSKVIEIPTEDGYIITSWLTSAEYKNGEGVMALSFSPKLKPYLLQLKKAFTSYRLANILSLKSAYSIRLYELLKKWQYLSKWECPIDNLKEKFGIQQSKYKQYGHFKSRVIDPAVQELNDKTDILVSYKEVRKGRKVTSIEFSISHRPERAIVFKSLKEKTPKGKEVNPSEKFKTLLNTMATGYTFDSSASLDIMDKSTAIWGEFAESNLLNLVRHVNLLKGILNKVGFFRSIINKAYEQHLNGESVALPSFNDSSEVLPDWFKQAQTTTDELSQDDFKEERYVLYKELNLRDEEIEKREKKLKDKLK